MRYIPSLITHEQFESRFLISSSLEEMWKEFLDYQHLKEDHPGNEGSSTCLIVADENVCKHHGERLHHLFPPEKNRWFVVPAGESSKNSSMWLDLVEFAFSGTLRRNTPMVAIGGGVTGDLAGFTAATLMRGLPLIHVPTTLLAMVDSAIGGKTGINHRFGKNTIGAFYQPRAVLFDITMLDTLPEREWLCGISEVLKYGYIRNPVLLSIAASLADPRSRTRPFLEKVVETSVNIKAEIVRADAREAGERAILNFGHSFAHALETLDGYRNITHGEAVYTGMIAAIFVSRKMGGDVSDRPLVSLKEIYKLSMKPYAEKADELVNLMRHDKKNRDDAFQLVLLEKAGKPVQQRVHSADLLKEAWLYTFGVLG